MLSARALNAKYAPGTGELKRIVRVRARESGTLEIAKVQVQVNLDAGSCWRAAAASQASGNKACLGAGAVMRFSIINPAPREALHQRDSLPWSHGCGPLFFQEVDAIVGTQ